MQTEEVSTNDSDWTPVGTEDCAVVRRHLERVLTSQLFANSRRYPNFLRYVVDETLAGRGEHLKERSLGIDVFARKPDYDTNLDHIVRSTATEVRRRLHLYYQENKASDICIDLPQRSYVPTFRRVRPQETRDSLRREPHPSHSFDRYNRWILYAALTGVGLLIGGAGVKLLTSVSVRASSNLPNQPGPSLITLLTPEPGHELNAITSDARLLALNMRPDTFVSLQAYESNQLPQSEPNAKATDLNTLQGITHHELQLASGIFQSAYPLQVSLKLPNQVTSEAFQRDNALLVGGPRANPWAQLFEDSLNFRTQLPAGARVALICNANPRAGEQRFYTDTPETDETSGHFYARIAYFPATSSHAKVLLVSGPRGVATFGALTFVGDPNASKDVLRLFHKASINDLPQFELLMKFTAAHGTITKTTIVASRIAENL
ncbi:MAG TPA: hypothetical protein VJS43_10525 [Candidatus Acidoferrales bacterium]|nr:hypothetical protein [Candidatus Acidoferrales bacterium]